MVEEYVESGMLVGLGTGSTASHAIWKIGELIENGSLSESGERRPRCGSLRWPVK